MPAGRLPIVYFLWPLQPECFGIFNNAGGKHSICQPANHIIFTFYIEGRNNVEFRCTLISQAAIIIRRTQYHGTRELEIARYFMSGGNQKSTDFVSLKSDSYGKRRRCNRNFVADIYFAEHYISDDSAVHFRPQ